MALQTWGQDVDVHLELVEAAVPDAFPRGVVGVVQQPAPRHPVDPLHHQRGAAADVAGQRVDGNDAGVLERAGGARFVNQRLHRALRRVAARHLHRHVATQRALAREQHLAHAALAEHAHHHQVTLKGFGDVVEAGRADGNLRQVDAFGRRLARHPQGLDRPVDGARRAQVVGGSRIARQGIEAQPGPQGVERGGGIGHRPPTLAPWGRRVQRGKRRGGVSPMPNVSHRRRRRRPSRTEWWPAPWRCPARPAARTEAQRPRARRCRGWSTTSRRSRWRRRAPACR